MRSIVVVVFFLIIAGPCLTSANQEVFDKSPEINLQWSWDLQFAYCGNDSDPCTAKLLFTPASSTFELNKDVLGTADNNTMLLVVTPQLTAASKLTDLKLSILVERFEEYFAWTNMTLNFTFSKTATPAFPIGQQVAYSQSTKKFFTRTDEVYECQSKIPVPLGDNVIISFWDMSFQAFEAEVLPASNRLREVCPRDFKSNVPITALTGASLLIIVAIAALIFGVNLYLERRKAKRN